jgi:hypothetical protein
MKCEGGKNNLNQRYEQKVIANQIKIRKIPDKGF